MANIPSSMKTRYIVIKLILDDGAFPSAPTSSNSQPQNVKIIRAQSDENSATVEIDIMKEAGFTQSEAHVVIYGLTKADSNAFSRFNLLSNYDMLKNYIEIYAGYTVNSSGYPPLCYAGQCYITGPDFNNPNRPLQVSSLLGIVDQNTIALETNPNGSIAISDLFKSIIAKAPKAPQNFIYHGDLVNGIAEYPHYTGSWINQLNQAVKDYGYKVKIDNYNIYVAPQGQAYTNNVYNLSVESGRIGYPTLSQFGIDCYGYYNPAIQFGQKVKIDDSELTIANGEWYVNGVIHSLGNRRSEWKTLYQLNTTAFNLSTTPGD